MAEKKRLLQYLYVLVGFFGGLFLLVLLFDKAIMPSMIHKRENVVMPDLKGMHVDLAKKKLFEIELYPEVISSQYDDKLPEGTVVNQSPKPQTEVKSGRTIFLTISKGIENTDVPDLVGRSIRQAKVLLMRKGFILGNIDYEFNESFPRDTVSAQSIRAGKEAAIGTSVDITVSLGSQSNVIVPKVVGMTLEQARVMLNTSGLQLGEVFYELDETYSPGTIISQMPGAYEESQKNSKVNITVVPGDGL